MTKGQFVGIIVIIAVVFSITTFNIGGSILGALIMGAIVAYGAGQPGGSGWK
jgi:hypothetical protein